MKYYSFIMESVPAPFGVSDAIGSLISADGSIPKNSTEIGVGAVGLGVGVGLGAIFTKYFNVVKKAIIESDTAQEAYEKFQDIVYNDRMFFTRRYLLRAPIIDRYFEKLVKRQDPDWKQKIIKRLNACKAMVMMTIGLVGAGSAVKGYRLNLNDQ